MLDNSVSLFGKSVRIRTRDCQVFDEPIRQFGDGKTVNIFIQLETGCNAKCQFCEYNKPSGKEFNFEKLSESIDEIQRNATVGKLNITGGEPTLNSENYLKLIELLRQKMSGFKFKPHVTLNTNGYNLGLIEQSLDVVDDIGLSRHHYDDKLNQKVFCTDSIPDTRNIVKLLDKLPNSEKYRLNLRCNLIKGYIDTYDKMCEYLEWASSLGVVWIGFVTLMPLNKFCTDNVVLDNQLFDDKRFFLTEDWKRYETNENGIDEVVCRCNDHIYVTKTGRMVRFYNRIFNNCNLNDGQLVYDGQNLRLGFSGDIIY